MHLSSILVKMHSYIQDVVEQRNPVVIIDKVLSCLYNENIASNGAYANSLGSVF